MFRNFIEETKMETILIIFSEYIQYLVSWWWITLSTVTTIVIIVLMLQADDYSLSTIKALQLSTAGLLSLIPLVKNYLPFKLKMDFWTRWEMLDIITPFALFVIYIAFFSYFLLPLIYLLFLTSVILDYYWSSAFGCDVDRYGFKRAVKLRLSSK